MKVMKVSFDLPGNGGDYDCEQREKKDDAGPLVHGRIVADLRGKTRVFCG